MPDLVVVDPVQVDLGPPDLDLAPLGLELVDLGGQGPESEASEAVLGLDYG